MRNLIALFLLTLLFTAFQTTSATLPTSVHRKRDLFNVKACKRCNKRLCDQIFKQAREKCYRKKESSRKETACIRKASKQRQTCIKFLFFIGKCLKICIPLFKSPSPSPSITPSISSTPSPTPSVTPSISSTPSATPSVTPSITPSKSATPSVTPSITPSPSPRPACECTIEVIDSIQLDAVCTSMISGVSVTGASFGVIVRGSIRQCILDLVFTQDELSRAELDCANCPTRDALDSCANNLRNLMVQRCFT